MAVSKYILSDIDDGFGLKLKGIDAKTTGTSSRRFNVRDALTCSVQINLATATGSGVRSTWTLKVSNDGINFAAFPVNQTLTVATSGAVISILLDVTVYSWVEVVCSTASTYTTETVDIIFSRQA
jgi:hypothetical protein